MFFILTFFCVLLLCYYLHNTCKQQKWLELNKTRWIVSILWVSEVEDERRGGFSWGELEVQWADVVITHTSHHAYTRMNAFVRLPETFLDIKHYFQWSLTWNAMPFRKLIRHNPATITYDVSKSTGILHFKKDTSEWQHRELSK